MHLMYTDILSGPDCSKVLLDSTHQTSPKIGIKIWNACDSKSAYEW